MKIQHVVLSFINLSHPLCICHPVVTDIGVLILVFNAAHCYPTIVPLFPQHTVRHYPYLRGSLPDLVPKLEVWERILIIRFAL